MGLACRGGHSVHFQGSIPIVFDRFDVDYSIVFEFPGSIIDESICILDKSIPAL